jgi:hypothetical protein
VAGLPAAACTLGGKYHDLDVNVKIQERRPSCENSLASSEGGGRGGREDEGETGDDCPCLSPRKQRQSAP